MAILRDSDPALSFDDIILVPRYSGIRSRLDTDLTTRLTKNITISGPVCSTNMSTVTDFQMMAAMAGKGLAGFLHRFLPADDILATVRHCAAYDVRPIVVSVGVKYEDYLLVEKLMNQEVIPDAILIDIAHGDSIMTHDMLQFIKGNFKIDVIVGNIATAEAAKRLCEYGADALRVGIGGGSVCATRTVTGHGMPTLQSIIDCFAVTYEYDVPIIADGGFKTSGDIVKALAFGAETVSLGGMLAGTSASPGHIIENEGRQYKEIYGMASKEAQERLRDGLKAGTAPEGVRKLVEYRGSTGDVLDEILGGIRSGLTYSGAHTIRELLDNSEYIILRAGGQRESKHL